MPAQRVPCERQPGRNFGEIFMRVLFGILLGVVLTIGVAFVADTLTKAPDAQAGTAVHRTMVNWDIVGENLRIVRQQAHEMWGRLSQKVTG
jgi:hypothetical protein